MGQIQLQGSLEAFTRSLQVIQDSISSINARLTRIELSTVNHSIPAASISHVEDDHHVENFNHHFQGHRPNL